jgi:AmpD protein
MTNSTVSQLNEEPLMKKNDLPLCKVFSIKQGWFGEIKNEGLVDENVQSIHISHSPSPHFTPKKDINDLSLLVVHNISLPPNVFGGDFITDFFLGKLDKNADPYFETIYEMKVSAHCLIKRDGSLVQYVSFLDKAWHAGLSSYKGRDKCNDFSIGIELEGADDVIYTEQQYKTLAQACLSIQQEYPNIKNNISGHNEIAPGRKTDPGDSFDWNYFYTYLQKIK